MKEQIKAPEKIQLSNEEIASQPTRCTVQNTGNQDTHRSGWVWSQNRRKSKDCEKWNKGNQHEGKETETQSNDLEQKEEINIWLEQNEERRIQKYKERFRNLWDNIKHSNNQIIWVPEGERKAKKLNTYLNK